MDLSPRAAENKDPADLTLKELKQEQMRLIAKVRGKESEAMTAREYQRLNSIQSLLKTIGKIKNSYRPITNDGGERAGCAMFP
jgi:hypothetical protein